MSEFNDEMVVPVRVIDHLLLLAMSDRDTYTSPLQASIHT
jgi:hypothetical protein